MGRLLLPGATMTSRDSQHERVSIIGIACRVPGAVSATQLWDLMIGNSDRAASGDVSINRRVMLRSALSDRHTSERALIGKYEFDYAAFGMSEREAQHTDPQQRHLLEAVWQLFDDAGIDNRLIDGDECGVYIGASSDDFRTSYIANGKLDRYGHMGTSRSLLANRVSHFYSFGGPSMVIDTGQSSSLVAVDSAVHAIRSGRIEYAVVAGISYNLIEEMTAQVELWGGLSPTDECHTLDARADGYARSEGLGCVLLQRESRALRDGNYIYASILGSATNNDGGHVNLGVPTASGQARVIQAAMKTAGVAASDVSYVELHGSGTPVGDPVEALALGHAMPAQRRHSPLHVGSIKPNIGHLEAAAGILGLIKCALQLDRKALVPLPNFATPNPDINFAELGIEPVVDVVSLDADSCVGVSSFGMGGTNAHTILASAPHQLASAHQASRGTSHLHVISADNDQALSTLAHEMLAHISRFSEIEIDDIARTLSRRRPQRCLSVIAASSREQLLDGLGRLKNGERGVIATAGLDDEALINRAEREFSTTTAAMEGLLTRSVPRGRNRAGLPGRIFRATNVPAFTPKGEASTNGASTPPGSGLLADWLGADSRDQIVILKKFLVDELSQVLGEPASSIATGRAFSDYAIDSMSLVELTNKFGDGLTLKISDVIVYEYPTIELLACYANSELIKRLEGDANE